MYNLYEAARKTGCTRILFASSNHAVGFDKQTDYLDDKALPRPDGLYCVSKVFSEAKTSPYHDKFGIKTATVRIRSCFPEPENHRMMGNGGTIWEPPNKAGNQKIMGESLKNCWMKEWNALSLMRLMLFIRVVILQLIRYMLPKMTERKGVTA